MMFQILSNINWCLIKFKKLGISTSSGHPAFWHCLWQKVREPFQRSKPLLCLLPSQALQPASINLWTTSMEPSLQIFWRHPLSHVFSELLLSSAQLWKSCFSLPVPWPIHEAIILWLPSLLRKWQQCRKSLWAGAPHLVIGCDMNISRGFCYDFCAKVSMPCPSKLAYRHTVEQHTLWNAELTFAIKCIKLT